MSDNFGLTPEGFHKKRLDDLVTALEGHFQDVYGVNFQVEPETKQGQIIANLANEFASLWDAAEDSFNSFNPSTALAKALSDLVQYNGLIRQVATQSQVTLTLTGTPATLIPAGSQAEVVDTGEKFATSVSVILDGGGNATVAAESVNFGPIVGAANTITNIFTPITGWSTVDNLSDAVLGLELESDEELRSRRNNSTAFNAQNIVESTAAQLLALDDVVHALVLENDTDTDPDANGVPAHSGEAIVSGGDDDDIGVILLRNKIPGIPWIGNTNIPTLDSQGVPIDLNVTRPTEVAIIVQVDVTATPDFPSGGADLIAQNIVDYAEGILIAARGFSVGDEVVTSELYTPVNLVPGHTVTLLEIAKFGDALGVPNVPIDLREVSVFTLANIVVNVT